MQSSETYTGQLSSFFSLGGSPTPQLFVSNVKSSLNKRKKTEHHHGVKDARELVLSPATELEINVDGVISLSSL